MTARDQILTAIRNALALTPSKPKANQSADAIAAEASALLDLPDSIRPALVDADPVRAFTLKATALGTTVEEVATLAEVPAAVRRYLSAHDLPAALALQAAPDLVSLDWAGQTESAQDAPDRDAAQSPLSGAGPTAITTYPGLAPDEPVALGRASYGIAESGSVVIRSGPDAPVLLSFLPLHHLVVLRAKAILPHLEDYAAVTATAPQPRNAILITGPSGTTDIEGSYVRGAHGPAFLHIVIVKDSG